MEITQDNFEAQLPLIRQSIANAEFIAIDTEFSGHSVSFDDKGHDYDTVEERYQKVKYTCQKFIAFQFGICTFHWDDVAKKYKCRPFNFYVFPKSQINDTSMLFQASAISFLTKNNFDFSKLFSMAITYTPIPLMNQMKQGCNYKVTKTFPSMRAYTSLSTSHQKKLETIMKEIDEWVFDTNSGENKFINILSYSLKKAIGKEVTKKYIGTGVFTEFNRQHPEIIIKKSKMFKQRNFMRTPHHSGDDVAGGSQSSLGFQFDEEEVKEEILKKSPIAELVGSSEAQRHAEEQEIKTLYDQEIGFTKVIQALMACKKPIIGHNMIMDLGFIYRQFLSQTGNLPKTYGEFVKEWNGSFPSTIYDTKVLSQSCGPTIFGKTDLQTVYRNCKNNKKLSNNVQIEFDMVKQDVFTLYSQQQNQQAHDAGYDAYMTGYSFICISKYIEIGKVFMKDGHTIAQSKPSSQLSICTTTKSKSSVGKHEQMISKAKKGAAKVINIVSDDSEEVENAESSRRKIRHYSMCQNRPIFYDNLDNFSNKVMLSIDIPRYFHLNSGLGATLTIQEQEFESRVKDNVIYVTLNRFQDAKAIANLFNAYGDINVVKATNLSCYVDFSFIDPGTVPTNKIADLMKKAEADIKKSQKGLIQSIVKYENAQRFVCKDSAIPFTY